MDLHRPEIGFGLKFVKICPRRVLAQRPKPEEASLKSVRIISVYSIYQRKSRFAQCARGNRIGSCAECPKVGIGRCDKCLYDDWSMMAQDE